MDEKAAVHRLAPALDANARDLDAELDWLARVLDARLRSYFGGEGAEPPLSIEPPPLQGSHSPYARFLRQHELDSSSRLLLLLALAPHVKPWLLDVLWLRNETTQRAFTEFGGVPGVAHGGFVPTGETALFLLSGTDLRGRLEATELFGDVVTLGAAPPGEPAWNGALTLPRDLLDLFTGGNTRRPAHSREFPARRLESGLAWHDLVLPPPTLEALEEIVGWIRHGERLLDEWDMRRKLRPGFTSLFYGPPGTGKTLAACLLGKHCGRDVYRIDLSLVVSKYIGETEKNLGAVFDAAEHKQWILFFDEADALFGKRTKVDDAHDRYANQEISFLLQRIEEFSGVVVLASNFKANIDDAFLRRFQSVVHFPMPRAGERLRLWQEGFPSKVRLADDLDLAQVAERYELSGGTIMNVVRYACLRALARDSDTILLEDVAEGARRECLKEGRTC
jgi:hypothetical protein